MMGGTEQRRRSAGPGLGPGQQIKHRGVGQYSSAQVGQYSLSQPDEIIATAVKRQHEPQRIVGDLPTAEISEKQALSIKYHIATAKLPMSDDINNFRFDGAPVDETVVCDLPAIRTAVRLRGIFSPRIRVGVSGRRH
jgi:hypothetical protein